MCFCFVCFSAQSSSTLFSQLYHVTHHRITVDSLQYQQLLSQSCLTVSAEEIVKHCYGVQEGQQQQQLAAQQQPQTQNSVKVRLRGSWLISYSVAA